MAVRIPARSTSKYAGQYAGTASAQRMVEIFADSCRIALTSKNPRTAGDRFALAVEAYHQLMSMRPDPDMGATVQKAMEDLVVLFPTQVVANEALGLREKAGKLKTPKKQLELLRQASSIVGSGLTQDPTNPLLLEVAGEIRAQVAESEAATT